MKEYLKKLTSSQKTVNIVIILVMLLVFNMLSPYFFTLSNFQNIALQSSIVSVVSLGAMTVLITGAVDLSSGSIVGLCMVLTVMLARTDMPIYFIIPLVLIGGLISGALNSFIIGNSGINPFLVTLGTMYVFRGIAFIISGGRTIPLGNSSIKNIFGGYYGIFPISFLYVIAMTIVVGFILSKTSIGRKIYTTGSNAIAATLSGIKTSRTRMVAYCIAGTLYALAALIAVARIGSGTPSYGDMLSMEAMASAVLGGTSFAGGSGTASGTLIGAILIVTLMNGLTIIGVNSYIQMIIKGLLILVAVYLDLMAHRRKK